MAILPGPNDESMNVSMAYVKYRGPTTLRRYGPKPEGHPTAGHACAACGVPMKVGDYTALIALGPGEDPEYRKAAREGQFYQALAVECHWACASGEEVVEENRE